MKKAVWSAAAAAAILMASTSASAQTTLATANITATATVGNQARLTLGGGPVNFPDTDPDLSSTITAAAVTIQARARVAPTTVVNLTVLAGASHFDPLTSTIPVGNLSWTVSGAPFVAGAVSSTTQQSVGQWTGPSTNNGSQTYTLQNLWSYAPGTYSLTLTYTLSTP
jgi:hypothetical protein